MHRGVVAMEFQLQNELQNLESEQELFKLTSSVELLTLPAKSSSSWKMFHGSTRGDFYRNEQLISSSSCSRSDFPSGFSDADCSSISLKQTNQTQQQQRLNLREGFLYRSAVDDDLHQQQISQDRFLGKGADFHQPHFELKNSKFLIPTQELLSEFCNLSGEDHTNLSKHKSLNINQWKNDQTCYTASSSSRKQSDLYTLDLVELEKRRAKLLSMLSEVDQRYRLYCDQIKALVSSMETVIGQGAATAYSRPASKAMSRHFRYLRDGILGQIKAIKEAMGEKDPHVIGQSGSTEATTTPRLRVLDQRLRQQRCFYQNASLVERQPWRPQRGLPERSVTVLRAWLFEHFLHPYPSDVDKLILARQAGLSRSQVSNWFINARVRLWKPMVEEMYLEETKDHRAQMLEEHHHRNINSSTATVTPGNVANIAFAGQNQEDHQKPAVTNRYNQFVHVDDYSHSCIDLPSMIIGNITDKGGDDHGSNGGIIDFDLSSYSHLHHHTQAMLPLANHDDDHIHHHQNYRNGSVSLTLGLHQHGSSSTFLFPKDPIADIEECKPFHQYSL